VPATAAAGMRARLQRLGDVPAVVELDRRAAALA
jgi:hypothetical protein